MENDIPTVTDNSQPVKEHGLSTAATDLNLNEPAEQHSQETPDAQEESESFVSSSSSDSDPRTSTRLVKFQLFETKAVYPICLTF